MACSVESIPVTTWHLQMPLEYDREGKVIHWVEGSRNFSTREDAEFALVSLTRVMAACGFNIDFNLVQENPYAEEFIQNKKDL